jgi:hypothetical protein
MRTAGPSFRSAQRLSAEGASPGLGQLPGEGSEVAVFPLRLGRASAAAPVWVFSTDAAAYPQTAPSSLSAIFCASHSAPLPRLASTKADALAS